MKRELTLALPRYIQDAENSSLIKKLCQSARSVTAPGLLHYFSAELSANLPIATVTGAVDGLNTQHGYWLRADPVDFQTDINSVYFFGIRHLDMNLHQARCIADMLRPIISDYGFELHVPAVYRWYLKLPEAVALKTPSPETMMGCSVRDYLTEVDISWRKMFTEIQMTLKLCEVNLCLKREISALWFWGGGYLPHLSSHTYQQIISDNNVVGEGIALLTNIAYQKFEPELLMSIKSLNNTLLVIDDLRVAISYALPLIYQALRRRQFDQLNMYLGDKNLYQISAKQVPAWWQFWR
jgi:hypothetical protein